MQREHFSEKGVTVICDGIQKEVKNVALKKASSKINKENMSSAGKLTELIKTNFGIGSFKLTLSFFDE